ncbi:hypothetical protein [Bradyrhizobium iriomotense]|uniref:Uncharacterized protein n=1 Tax=Bradyrhizobium iriomotense TaxID=441950 RepID=A0ABQ6B856_9BRAD|nr:hypothetical protein [Bradyrhizobium iriomotense]GLR89584.1 hypothetical protein GCM10007857_62970 [Bradyrhizobium iriomotense]
MNSVPNTTQIEPRHVLSTRMDEELTHTYEKIKSVDEEIARASEQLSRLERDDARTRPPRGRPVLRGLVGLVLAGGIGTVALISQSSRGDEVRQMIAGWAPLRAAMPSPSQAQPAPGVEPSPTVQLAQASPEPAAVQAVPEAAAPTATTLPPQVTELLEKMAGDLANVQQGIEQLKASQAQLKANQEQMSQDNLRVADELKASQEQMARLVAKTPDNKAPVNAPDKTAGKTAHQASDPKAAVAAVPAAPRPAAASARKPAQAAPTPHAAVRRSAPVQLESAEQ